MVVPDREASCSLVDSCPVEQVRAFKRRNPDHVIVSYINTSVEVKAESDILCTSRNAVDVVNSIPAEKPILFLPDINLGNYVKKQTGRENMKIWQGACIVHATFPRGASLAAERTSGRAGRRASGVSRRSCSRMADFIGPLPPSSIGAPTARDEFIVMTESGVSHSLHSWRPDKKFYFVANENCNCSECPYMKQNTLEKLLRLSRNLEPRVEIAARDHAARAAADRAHAGRQVDARVRLVQLAPPFTASCARSARCRHFDRMHDNLRISVTDRCNIRCFYCMPETGGEFVDRAEILAFEEIVRFRAHRGALGSTSCASPAASLLLRRDLPDLVARLAVPADRDLALTTNGVLLAENGAAAVRRGTPPLERTFRHARSRTFQAITRRDDLPTACWPESKRRSRIGFRQ